MGSWMQYKIQFYWLDYCAQFVHIFVFFFFFFFLLLITRAALQHKTDNGGGGAFTAVGCKNNNNKKKKCLILLLLGGGYDKREKHRNTEHTLIRSHKSRQKILACSYINQLGAVQWHYLVCFYTVIWVIQ